ncbi:MAG: PTS sugar transporter subunit IIA, partial [Candidatus Acidiferrales bacterium]
NARGAMEMILGLLALQAGLIKDSMFVALVVMALFTSMISAPAIHYLLRGRKSLTLRDVVNAKFFMPNLETRSKTEALQQMCTLAADAVSNSPERFLRLVLERERVSPSGWQNGLAVPHSRVGGVLQPIVVVARSRDGIDFDARDGKPARLIVLILTEDNQTQQDLVRDAGQLFANKEAVDQALAAGTFVELVAALKAPVQ